VTWLTQRNLSVIFHMCGDEIREPVPWLKC